MNNAKSKNKSLVLLLLMLAALGAQGADLAANADLEIITELETEYGFEIPQLREINVHSVGYVLMNGRVTEFGLYNKSVNDVSKI